MLLELHCAPHSAIPHQHSSSAESAHDIRVLGFLDNIISQVDPYFAGYIFAFSLYKSSHLPETGR